MWIYTGEINYAIHAIKQNNEKGVWTQNTIGNYFKQAFDSIKKTELQHKKEGRKNSQLLKNWTSHCICRWNSGNCENKKIMEKT